MVIQQNPVRVEEVVVHLDLVPGELVRMAVPLEVEEVEEVEVPLVVPVVQALAVVVLYFLGKKK
jgi:hypothetical protein